MDIGAAENDTEREATYRFLNAEVSEQHRMLMEDTHALDTKATVVAGVAAAAVSFLLAHRRQTIWWLALGGYFLALAFALGTLWPRRWQGLVPSELRDELSEAAPVLVIGEVAGSKASVYDRNSRKARQKALLWMASVLVLAVGSALAVWTTITERLR